MEIEGSVKDNDDSLIIVSKTIPKGKSELSSKFSTAQKIPTVNIKKQFYKF